MVPDGYWQHLAANPRQAAIFNAAMTGKTHAHVAGILRAFDFTPFRRIGDIGGGRGHLLHSVLDIAPAARGLLFDQPHVIEENHALASERIELVGGDFFMDALPDCDLYLLMEIVHDWPDPQAVAILRNVRRAAPADARLLVIEELRSEGSELDWAKTLDVLMLGLLGGRQRTVDEHRALLDEAGWRVERVIGTTGGTSIIEVVAAGPRQR
ncbi:MAG TPA: methyltransferase [Rhodanobacteraceae bacterium]|nr:methyltransferase [Rhodanobacteraceae bacterium]